MEYARKNVEKTKKIAKKFVPQIASASWTRAR